MCIFHLYSKSSRPSFWVLLEELFPVLDLPGWVNHDSFPPWVLWSLTMANSYNHKWVICCTPLPWLAHEILQSDGLNERASCSHSFGGWKSWPRWWQACFLWVFIPWFAYLPFTGSSLVDVLYHTHPWCQALKHTWMGPRDRQHSHDYQHSLKDGL